MITSDEELNLIAQELQKLFNLHELNKIAKQTGFIQRQRKLTAESFLFTFVFSGINTNEESLNVINGKLEAETSVSLSNQGLNEHINKKAVNFLKEIFTRLLNKKFNHTSSIQSRLGDNFNRIWILDSTSYQLPPNMSPKYKGSGGSSSEAGIKIQFEYDLKTGDFRHIELCNGTDNDAKYGSKYIKTVASGDLCIRDLGYFKIKDFINLNNIGAKYISRLKSGISIYIKNNSLEYLNNAEIQKQSLYQKVDLKEIINSLKLGETMELDDVYIGSGKNKLQTRLIAYKLTEKQLKERIKKSSKKESRNGITITEKTKELMSINIYITNISENIASKNEIHELYSLRWQVEIIFKIWKSIFDIDNVKPAKLERFECHLYGKLIAITISSLLVFKMRCMLLEKKKKEVSEIKAFSIIREYLGNLYRSFTGSLQDIQKLLLRILEMIGKNGLKSKKGKKKTVFDILIVFTELDQQKKKVA